MRHTTLRWTAATLLILGTVGCSGRQHTATNFRNRWHDQGVRSAVRLQLMRDDRVQARHVRVAVRDNQVTLQGHVRSAAERARAEENAWRATGVASVVNRIEVMDRSTLPAAPAMVATRGQSLPQQALSRKTSPYVAPQRRAQNDFTPSLVTSPVQEGRAQSAIAAPKPKPAAPAKPSPAVVKQKKTPSAAPAVVITKKPPVIGTPANADGGYIDRGMLPPATTVGGKPTADVAAPAWVKRDSATDLPAAPLKTAAPVKSPAATPTATRAAPVRDDSLAQEAAEELRRLKQGQ